jgi:hypothetical protein
MYRVVGADGKEYGPATAEEVRQWVQEGRVHANSAARTEGGIDWRRLSAFPEFASLFPQTNPAAFQGQPAYQESNGMAIAGLVCSCLAVVCCGCAPFAVLGIIFSCIGLSQTNRDSRQAGRGLAIAGLIIGIIALLETALFWMFGLMGAVLEKL